MGTLRLLQSFSLLFRRSSSKPLLNIMKLLFVAVLFAVAVSGIIAAPAHDPEDDIDVLDGEMMEHEDVHAYLNLLDKIPGARRLMNKIKPFLKSTKAIWSKVGSSMGAKIKEATKEMMAKFPDIAAKVGAIGAKTLVTAALPAIIGAFGK